FAARTSDTPRTKQGLPPCFPLQTPRTGTHAPTTRERGGRPERLRRLVRVEFAGQAPRDQPLRFRSPAPSSYFQMMSMVRSWMRLVFAPQHSKVSHGWVQARRQKIPRQSLRGKDALAHLPADALWPLRTRRKAGAG